MTVTDRFLVTGAVGCVGAWVLRTLIERGCSAVGLDITTYAPRIDVVLTDELNDKATLVAGDITNPDVVTRMLDEHSITHVIHLAALQVPACRNDPFRGALVNVAGTVNVFEAVRQRQDQIRGLAYASSAAVYGPGDASDQTPVPSDAPPRPATLYGVYKQANEAAARVYWSEHAVASIGLRPYVVYGPGRDQGLTSAPTVAMLAAVFARNYRIPFGGRFQFQFAQDVARAFIAASTCGHRGSAVLNLPGRATSMADVVASIETAAPEAVGRITFEDTPLPFPAEFESDGFTDVVGPLANTDLTDGVSRTISSFREYKAGGLVAPPADVAQ